MQLPVAGAAVRSASPPHSDIRVLIDVSGSMKKNDPHNLRAPALRLIVGLLPDGAKAGVWTFGQYVNMLVPQGTVDKAWREKARAASRQINSAGLFTNIEGALSRSTWDWHDPNPHTRRSLIILTDGLVDISKDSAKNAASRRHILDDILPRLEKAGVTVHTIALSGNADRSLLKQLAAGTGGHFTQVDDADALDKTFLHIFERTTHRDTLPLTHNEIQVDKHIEELTLLIFRKHGASPTRIMTPGHKAIGRDNPPADVRWHHERGYDLITVERPEPGRWKVLAGEDPDNRVMVVTNLKLKVGTLPAQTLVDQKVPVTVRLTEKGRTITRRRFLNFVDVTLIQNDPNGKTWRWPVRDDGITPDKKAHDGIYTFQLGDSLTPGRHEFRILVDGITFQRESHRLINVYKSPVITTLSPATADSGARFSLSIIPRAGLVEPASMTVHAQVTDPAGHQTEMDIPRVHSNEWRKTLGDAPGVYRLTLNIQGRTPQGKSVDYTENDLSFGDSSALAPQSAPPAPKTAPKASKAAATTMHAPAPKAKAEHKTEPTPRRTPARSAGSVEWTLFASLIITVNLIVLGGGYIAWRRLRTKTHLSITELEEELA